MDERNYQFLRRLQKEGFITLKSVSYTHLCNNKGYYVVDADIEKFFDNVNQDKLMKLVEQRISDRKILISVRGSVGFLSGNSRISRQPMMGMRNQVKHQAGWHPAMLNQ